MSLCITATGNHFGHTSTLEPGHVYKIPLVTNYIYSSSNTDSTNVEWYTIDTREWNRSVSWNDMYVSVSDTSNTYNFWFRWVGTNDTPFTVNFAPLEEEREVAPRDFFAFLHRLGYDDEYLRTQREMQSELFVRENITPPWEWINFDDLNRRMELMEERRKQLLLQRWGIKEFPKITPELLDQIKKTSREFLAKWLSPAELEMYDKEGHVKIPSPSDEQVYYIVRKGAHKKIEQYKNGKLVALLCYVSQWDELPHDDIIAMKVFDLKYNEEEVLKKANITRVVHPNFSSTQWR